MAKVIYVDDNASQGGDGSSWATAHKHLQDALAVAEYGDEIWVAEGTYKPDQGAGKTAGDRTSPFVLVNGVGMYGGFLGTEVTRDPQGDNNQTILSGEIDSNSSLWSLNVVSGANLDANTTLEGFRITKGNANGASGTFYVNGGGAYLKDSHLSLINLIFNNNSASGSGGGSFSTYDLNLTNCVFTNNSAYYGGGIFSPSINLNNCVFTNNSAVGYGGGVSGDGTITNCIFINNFASIKGGGVRGNGTFIGCIFTSNSARDYGGGVQGDGSFTNCVFNNNSVSNYGNGGGISGGISSSSLNLKNCVFTNNSAVGYGGGVSGDGTITNCVFINNSASVAGGGINSSLLKLTNSILLNNFSNGFKGHGLNSADWKSIVINNAVEAEYPGDPNAKDAVYYPNLNILEGWTGDTRAFDSVPLFVNIENPIGHDGEWFTADDGLRLQAGSPAIDSGYDSNDTANYSDLAGFGRKQGENIDIGAYEYGDLKPNLVDLKIPKNLISYHNTFVTLFPERENMIDYFYHDIYGDAAEWSRTVDLNIASNKKFYYVSSHYWPWVNKSNPSKLYFPVIEADEWTQNVGSQVHSLLDVPDHTKDSIYDPKNNYVWTIQLPENGAQVLEPHLYFDISTLALPTEAGFVTEGGTFSSLTSHKFDAISYPGYRFEKWTGSIDSSDSQVTIEALPDQHDITLIANFQKVVPEFNDLSSGWIELENFGPLWSNYEYGGWMFSTKLEWIYVHSLDQNGIWFYSDKLGWNWFSISRTWPYVFNHQTYSWMYYSEESSKKFFHYKINSRINEINFEEIYRQYDIQKNNFFEYSFNSEGKLSVWLVKPFTHTTTSPSGGTIYLGGQSHIGPDESELEYYSSLVWVPKGQ